MWAICLVLTSYASAKEFMVSASTGDDATGNPDTGMPFATISGVFKSITGNETAIIVMLEPSETPYNLICREAEKELVFRTDCGGTCSETQRATILIQPGSTCYISTTKVSFIDVVLTDYQDDLCSYCILDQLYVDLNGTKVLANGTDKATIDQIRRSPCPQDCPAEIQTIKIFSHSPSNVNSSFTLERVKMESIRAGYSSFIETINTSEVTLKDCTLTGLYFSGYVFEVNKVANFTASNCNITNLNPNFPIKQVAQNIGLLKVKTGTSVTLDRVVFADNNVVMNETYAFNIDSQSHTIHSCTFKNNLMCLITTTAPKLVVSGTKDLNTLFEGNYAYGFPLILASSYNSKVSMHFTAFKSNHCRKCDANVFAFTSSGLEGTAMLDYVTISNSGSHTDGTGAVISFARFVSIAMTNCDFSDNTKFNEAYASRYSTLYRFIQVDAKHVSTSIVQDLLKLPLNPKCSRVVYIEESLALVIESSKFKSNSGCDSALTITQSELSEDPHSFKLSSVSFEKSSTAVQVTSSLCSDECTVIITDCNFLNNVKSLGIELVSSMKAAVSNSHFTQDNPALLAQYGLDFSGLDLEVTSCTFTGLRTQSTSALHIKTPTAGQVTVAISSSEFINTNSRSGFSDLTIENEELELLLTISNCRFQSNNEDNYGSLSITATNLDTRSVISDTLFTGYSFTSMNFIILTTHQTYSERCDFH
jgi:hypothetical protein